MLLMRRNARVVRRRDEIGYQTVGETDKPVVQHRTNSRQIGAEMYIFGLQIEKLMNVRGLIRVRDRRAFWTRKSAVYFPDPLPGFMCTPSSVKSPATFAFTDISRAF